jgi:N-acetylglucosamine kinase-like BadF-type ATPase
MKNYFLGVDIGGTKSHAVISDHEGQVVGFGRAGSGSWEFVGYDGLRQVLNDITTQALQMANVNQSKIKGAGFGVAGYDWPSQRQPHLDVIQTLGLNCPIELVNDAALGNPAAAREGWGISVVSGTGCNCRGWNADRSRIGRAVGGYSEWSNEFAGGWDILLRAMRAISFEWTNRGPATALTPAFLEKTDVDDLDEFVEGAYLQKFNFDDADVMLVFKIASQGDSEALNVIRWAGNQLGQMACGVIRQVGLENETFEVVQIGSLYDGHPLISEQMERTIHKTAPGAKLIRLSTSPVVGGVLLGMEAGMGKEAYAHRQRVLETIQELNL